MVPAGCDETIIEVWVNCPDEKTAAAIADAIVGERLAAAANIYPSISSRYHWKGSIVSACEIPLLFKTKQSLFEALAERVAELHPYETPSIIAKKVKSAHTPYRAWLIDEVAE
ncbi:MAG: divalent-cation tolerance protein CutA [Geminicoccaceae bacterium]